VFDTRGNTGGDSIWTVRILEALYGLEYLSSVSWPKDVKGYAEIRATEEGLRRFKNALLLETDPEIKQLISDEIKKLSDALLQGKATYTRSMDINDFDFSKKPQTNSTLNPIQGQVYLLTDHTCFSSGLMFADLILSIPGVKHIGQETDGDTVFSQTSSFELESQLGRVVCPTMIKRNRARRDNETYTPEKIFPGPINDFQALKSWVIENTPF